MPAIVSINIATPAQVIWDGGREMFSAILKKPVVERIFLDTTGFRGDGCADQRHHGGLNKAACVYCLDHYPFWERELSRKLFPGSFGENLSVSGLEENSVHIGDIFRAGEAEMQISQPRQPCHKLNKIFGLNDMVERVQGTGFTGFYFRVLKAGWVEPGCNLTLTKTSDQRVTVAMANHLMYVDQKNLEGIHKLLSLDSLSDEWKVIFATRLRKMRVL